jgi:hypothetical protein
MSQLLTLSIDDEDTSQSSNGVEVYNSAYLLAGTVHRYQK